MDKQTFLTQLRKKLSDLPQGELDDRLTFYREMIEDRMEEGLSEEEAVSAVGSVDEIAAQIVESVANGNKKPSRQWKVWELVLLILGTPVWLSLLIAAFAVVLSLYVSLWAVIVSLWATVFALGACSIGGLFAGIVFACSSIPLSAVAMIGAGMVCAGLAIALFYGCNLATKGTLILTRNCFRKKEVA